MDWSARSPAMLRIPGLPSNDGGSGRGSESSLLSAAGLTLGAAVGMANAVFRYLQSCL